MLMILPYGVGSFASFSTGAMTGLMIEFIGGGGGGGGGSGGGLPRWDRRRRLLSIGIF